MAKFWKQASLISKPCPALPLLTAQSLETRPEQGYSRAGGKGTAGTAMAVPVFEGEKMASLGF